MDDCPRYADFSKYDRFFLWYWVVFTAACTLYGLWADIWVWQASAFFGLLQFRAQYRSGQRQVLKRTLAASVGVDVSKWWWR